MAREFDILIAGGGPVGASLALALQPHGLAVGLVESRAGSPQRSNEEDARATALSWRSHEILSSLALWPRIQDAATPIRRVHVSEHGRFGVTVLDADELALPALGYVVENALLQQALDEAIAGTSVARMQPAQITALDQDASGVTARVNGDEARARLLVVAEGAMSSTRALLDIDVDEHDYGQCALVANVATAMPHRGTAWERFTQDGPLAMLPLRGNRCAVVWTQRSEHAASMLALDDEAFAARINASFGNRLGRIERVGRRQSWPLARRLATRQRVGRALLLGNAAHSLHPIAAQGFNLSLHDAATLVDAIAGGDPGDATALDRWVATRRRAQRRVGTFIDGLNSLFTLDLPGLGIMRGKALGLFGLCPGARKRLARFGAGSGVNLTLR